MMRAASLLRLSPLLLLTAALVALAVFFVHDARPAAAQSADTIWIATLDLLSNSDSCNEDPITPGTIECSLLLTDNEFTIGDVVYQVTRVDTDPGPQGTRIQFDKAIPANLKSSLTFHVNNRSLPLADATLAQSDKAAIWSNVRSLWSQGDDLSLRLTIRDPATVWIATLDLPSNSDSCDENPITPGTIECSLLLTDNEFTIGGEVYQVTKVDTDPAHQGTRIVLDKAIPANLKSSLTFHVNNRALALADATLANSDKTAIWSNVRSLWSQGDDLSLRLTGASSSDTTLSALTAESSQDGSDFATELTLTPDFATAITSYSAGVGGIVTHARLTPTLSHGTSWVLVNGQAVASGSPSAAIALEMGANTITVRVTAENGSTRDYTVTVQKLTAARLSDLEVLDEYGSLRMRPGKFEGNWPEQTQVIFVAPGIRRVKIKPHWPEASSITVTVSTSDMTQKHVTYSTATVSTSGEESEYLTISDSGGTKLNITVTEGNDTTEYGSKYVTRELNAANADNYLNSMGVSPNPNARMSFSGQSYPGYYNVLHREPGAAGDLIRNVSYQSAGPLTSWWQPASGYPRILPSDPYTPVAGLPQQNSGSITLTPTFDPYVQEYTATVRHEVSSVFVNLSLSHPKASATVNGNSLSTPVSLEVGENVVEVVVTAESGVQRTYTLTITREFPNRPPAVASAIADGTIINESGTRQVSLSDVFTDADGDELTITSNSSGDSVATVSVSADQSTLTVTAKGRGTAVIGVNATDGRGGEIWDLFFVKVKAAPTVASAIADVSELEVDATHQVSMSGVFSDADGDAVTVTQASSSDTSIAAVSAAIDGATAAITAVTVTANSEGTATITVTARDADGNTVSDAFDVTVNAPAAQQQKVNNPPTVSGAIADATIVSESGTRQVSLSGVFDDADGDDLTITARSSDESVATVSVSADYSTLTLTAQGRGTATITVTAADGYDGSVADSYTVTVKSAPVVASAISDVSGLEEGATQDVSLSGVFSDGDGDALTITASSSDEGKATVSVAADRSALTVSGVSEGTATITVTAQDADGNTVSDAFQVEVVQIPEPEPEPVQLPGPVLGLELTATHDSVSVRWSAPESGDAPDGYIVNIKRQGGGDGETRRPGAGKTSLTFRDLNGGSTYEVWVRAENEAGKGERTHATVTLPSELPGPVTGLEVAATEDAVTVSWQAPETGGAPDGYIVHVRPEDGAEGSGRTKTPRAKKTRVSFENLEAGQTYKVWVRAQNAAGKGERVHASITLP